MAGLVSTLLLLTVQYVLVDGTNGTVRWAYKPYGILMCTALCQDLRDAFSYTQEDLTCHRVSAIHSAGSVNVSPQHFHTEDGNTKLEFGCPFQRGLDVCSCKDRGSTVWGQYQTCQLQLHRLLIFDEKSVSDFALTTQDGLGKLWMCTRMCSEDCRCRSFRYNMTGVCSTYAIGYSTSANTFNAVSTEPGSRLYLMYGKTHTFGTACTSTVDCNFASSSCRNGSCQCSVGYSFDLNTGDCLTHCARYGDFFGKYPGEGVREYNIAVRNTTTSDACMEACRDHTAFVCINVEYDLRSGECNMCNETWFDLDPDSRETNNYLWVLYYRHCAL